MAFGVALSAGKVSAQQCTEIELLQTPEFIITGFGTCLGGTVPERDVLEFQPTPLPLCGPCAIEVTATWATGTDSQVGAVWPYRS